MNAGVRRCFGAGATAFLLAAGCGGESGADPPVIEVWVSAAASIGEAFNELADAFEAATPGIDVVINRGSSSLLREQILEGAPIDVFAPAGTSVIETLQVAGEIAGEVELLGHNVLQIAIPTGNPAGVASLDDFARADLLIGLCAPGVPCGDYGRLVLAQAGIAEMIDSYEPNARALLTKIEEGELDAGIVYRTDVIFAGGKVGGLEIGEEHNVVVAYPIMTLAGSRHPDVAAAFVDFALSTEGWAILRRHGFSAP